MRFFVGLHHEADAWRFDRCMVSINTLRRRKSGFAARVWMLDSGAFMEISTYGRYRDDVGTYARQIMRWWGAGGLLVAAVSQDYMCEPIIISGGTIKRYGKLIHIPGTGLSVAEHQRLTIERYTALRAIVWPWVYIMPVLQGYEPEEYVSHVEQYGDRLKDGAWVGVGSVCKRNAKVDAIEDVLMAIKRVRPDLRLHGFGVKTTALESAIVRTFLHSADSLAWSDAARREGRDRNSPLEAKAFADRIGNQRPVARQARLF